MRELGRPQPSVPARFDKVSTRALRSDRLYTGRHDVPVKKVLAFMPACCSGRCSVLRRTLPAPHPVDSTLALTVYPCSAGQGSVGQCRQERLAGRSTVRSRHTDFWTYPSSRASTTTRLLPQQARAAARNGIAYLPLVVSSGIDQMTITTPYTPSTTIPKISQASSRWLIHDSDSHLWSATLSRIPTYTSRNCRGTICTRGRLSVE